MCGPMALVGATLGIAQGALAVSGQQETARKNQRAAVDNQRINKIQNQREFVVESDASLKEAHQASLEQRAAAATALASSGGFSGSTAGARVSEQNRQGALSISNAKDRYEAALGNYELEEDAEFMKTSNYIATQELSPGYIVGTIAGGAFSGAQQWGSLGSSGTKARFS